MCPSSIMRRQNFSAHAMFDVGEAVRAVAEERRGVAVLEAVTQELGYAVHLAWRE